MKRLLALLIISGILSSCDPFTSGTAFVENKSTSKIYLIRGDNADSINADETKTYGPVSGYPGGLVPHDIVIFDTVKNDTAICKENISDDANWESIKLSKNVWEHHFVVTDADF